MARSILSPIEVSRTITIRIIEEGDCVHVITKDENHIPTHSHPDFFSEMKDTVRHSAVRKTLDTHLKVLRERILNKLAEEIK